MDKDEKAYFKESVKRYVSTYILYHLRKKNAYSQKAINMLTIIGGGGIKTLIFGVCIFLQGHTTAIQRKFLKKLNLATKSL